MKLNHSLKTYVFQLSLMSIFIFIIVCLFREASKVDVLWALGVSALASSSFLLFTRPSSPDLSEFCFLASYAINITVGAITHFLLNLLHLLPVVHDPESKFFLFAFMTSMALGLSFILMLVLKVRHPSALGLCIVMIINFTRWDIAFVTVVGVLLLSAVHFFLKPYLKDL